MRRIPWSALPADVKDRMILEATAPGSWYADPRVPPQNGVLPKGRLASAPFADDAAAPIPPPECDAVDKHVPAPFNAVFEDPQWYDRLEQIVRQKPHAGGHLPTPPSQKPIL